MRLMDGRIEVIENNNAANPIDVGTQSPLWKPVHCGEKPTRFIADGGDVRLTAIDENFKDWDGCAWKDLQIDIEPPELLKVLALSPINAESKESFLYIDNSGERLPLRGGSWLGGANAGVFALNLNSARSLSFSNIGFRAAYYRKTGN